LDSVSTYTGAILQPFFSLKNQKAAALVTSLSALAENIGFLVTR